MSTDKLEGLEMRGAASDQAVDQEVPSASALNKPHIDYRLYMVTDRNLMSSPTIEKNVEDACKGGVTLVQLREKNVDTSKFLDIAKSVKQITDAYGVALIINDNVEVALETDAAGVHVGQDDMPASMVRELVGSSKIVGVSVSNVDEAIRAEQDGADYLGIGAMSFTSTKPDAKVVGIDMVPKILDAVHIPSVVIGGINERTIPHFAGMDLAGFSVVSAIVAAEDVEGAAFRLRRLVDAQLG